MKKIIAVLVLITSLSACYDDYVKNFEYDSVYFPYQLDTRTFVVGEGMSIRLGAVLGGVRVNDRDRTIQYTFDNSLITTERLAAFQGAAAYVQQAVSGVTALNLLPSNYYSLSDGSKIVIRKGEHSGPLTVKADSASFLSDPATLNAGYVLPFRITSADADSILPNKNFMVLGLKYENMLFGNYWHGGVTIEKDASGAVISETKYYTTIPSPDSKAWVLKTVAPFELVTNGVSAISSSTKPEFKLTVNGGNITISNVEGATYQVQPDGTSTYNQAKLLQDRKIFLNYKYQNIAGNWCYAKDTLTFRNRIRDGVNEWQDENRTNY
jgi:hypothetical protein